MLHFFWKRVYIRSFKRLTIHGHFGHSVHFPEKVQECESRLGSVPTNGVIVPVSTAELFVFTADICDPETEAYKEVGKQFCDEVSPLVPATGEIYFARLGQKV